MAQLRICDRCQAPVAAPIDVDGTRRNIILPASAPATAKVGDDFGCEFAVQSKADLCDVCLLSAMVEFALTRVGPKLTAAVIAAIGARIKAYVGGGA